MSNQETKKVLTVVDKSTKALATVASQVAVVVADLQNTASIAASLAQDIEFRQNELENLESQLHTQQREQAAELRLRIREDEDSVLNELLTARGLVTTTEQEISETNNQILELTGLADRTEFKAVKEAESKLHSSYGVKISTIEAEHKVEIAELKADAKSDKAQLAAQAETIEQLRADIKAEREARISIAESAAKAQGVVVNTGK